MSIYLNPRERGEVTRRAAPPRWCQSLAKRAECSRFVHCLALLIRRQRHPGLECRSPRLRFLALTFSTLLSSQGADAHRGGSLNRSRGNLRNFTRSAACRQTRECDRSDRAADIRGGDPAACFRLSHGPPATPPGSRYGARCSMGKTKLPTGTGGVNLTRRARSPRPSDPGDRALSPAQHQPLPVQGVYGSRHCGPVGDPDIVEVGAALGDGAPGLRGARAQSRPE